MAKVTPLVDNRIETVDKMQSAQLRKGVPIELPPGLFSIYQKTYGDLGVEIAEAKETQEVDRLTVIAQAISEVLDEGDDTKLTAEGDVRTNILSDIVGFKVSSDERDAAMELI